MPDFESSSDLEFSTLLYEERDGVAWVTLNRPERYNAFDLVMAGEFTGCGQRSGTGIRCGASC